MKAIFDDLSQYNLKRINDIHDAGFENDCIMRYKYYLCTHIHNNTVVSLYVCEKMNRYIIFIYM